MKLGTILEGWARIYSFDYKPFHVGKDGRYTKPKDITDNHPVVLRLGQFKNGNTGNWIMWGLNLRYIQSDEQMEELKEIMPSVMKHRNPQNRYKALKKALGGTSINLDDVFRYYDVQFMSVPVNRSVFTWSKGPVVPIEKLPVEPKKEPHIPIIPEPEVPKIKEVDPVSDVEPEDILGPDFDDDDDWNLEPDEEDLEAGLDPELEVDLPGPSGIRRKESFPLKSGNFEKWWSQYGSDLPSELQKALSPGLSPRDKPKKEVIDPDEDILEIEPEEELDLW